jgi:hypothetical protein
MHKLARTAMIRPERYKIEEEPMMLPRIYRANEPLGSHMPIDTEIHWSWSNPLNVLPAALLLIILIGLVGLVLL